MDIFKKHKQIEDNGGYIHKRDLEAETSYLSQEFLNMQKQENTGYNVMDENLSSKLNKYLEIQGGELQGEAYSNKAKKYTKVINSKIGKNNETGVAIREYAGSYGNHGTSKRKKSFKSSAKYYNSAASKATALNTKLRSGNIDRNSNEFIEARIDILKDRLKGMTEAAEAKSYSSNDEKLRKNAAKVKIYSAMLRVYNEKPEEYRKKIAQLQQDLDRSLTEYKRLMPADREEKRLEEAKRRRKTEQVRSVGQIDVDQLQQEIRYILRGESVDYIPSGAKLTYYENGRFVRQAITKEMLEKAMKNVKLNRSIGDKTRSNPDDIDNILDRELSNNNNKDFSIIQAVLAAYKKELLSKTAGYNGIKGLMNAVEQYVRETAICRKINNYLRKGDDSDRLAKQYGDDLKTGLNNTTLDYDLVVRRGVNYDAIGFMMGLSQEEAGDNELIKEKIHEYVSNGKELLCEDKGVISTTTFGEGGFNGNLDLVILCKKGTRALDISHGNGARGNEEEVMLAPGTKFIVRKFKELEGSGSSGEKRWRIYLETVTANDPGELA